MSDMTRVTEKALVWLHRDAPRAEFSKTDAWRWGIATVTINSLIERGMLERAPGPGVAWRLSAGGRAAADREETTP